MPGDENLRDLVIDSVRAAGYGDGQLLQVLIGIQRVHGSVPAEAIPLLAEQLSVSESEIRGVLSFYSFIHEGSPIRYDVRFSDNITDRMFGSGVLHQRLCEKLGISEDDCIDGEVQVTTTSCTGLCDQGPALLVNGTAIPALCDERIDQIADLISARVPVSDWPQDLFGIQDNIQLQGPMLGERVDEGGALKVWQGQGSEVILDMLEKSGLRGRGGAGFATAAKWRMCRDAVSRCGERSGVVVCNADEGEPGTFKDRVLLNSYAEDMIEGMTLCAATIGADSGFIYLRAEYEFLQKELEEILENRRVLGLLGNRILGVDGFDFDIVVHLGAGAYICGEESALIESLEGKRGVPRIRPPFPVTSGYLGRPTVVNNVETFKSAAHIAVHGAEWLRAHGTETSSGTKLLSISGDCERPGIYEFPFGVSIREVLEACGGEDATAVQVAGAAGTTLPASSFDRRIAFEDVSTGGSFMVFGKQREILDVVQNFVHFFVHESCGLCTSCRVGTSLQRDLVDRIHARRAGRRDIEELRTVAEVMRTTSHCGLGATAASPVLDTLKYFPTIYDERIRDDDSITCFDLDEALSDSVALTARVATVPSGGER